MQKVEVTLKWFNLKSNYFKERTGLFIGHMQIGEFYLNHDDKWVVIVNGNKFGEYQLIGRSEAAIILLTAAKQLLKIED